MLSSVPYGYSGGFCVEFHYSSNDTHNYHNLYVSTHINVKQWYQNNRIKQFSVPKSPNSTGFYAVSDNFQANYSWSEQAPVAALCLDCWNQRSVTHNRTSHIKQNAEWSTWHSSVRVCGSKFCRISVYQWDMFSSSFGDLLPTESICVI